jgi:hypothetical protein
MTVVVSAHTYTDCAFVFTSCCRNRSNVQVQWRLPRRLCRLRRLLQLRLQLRKRL